MFYIFCLLAFITYFLPTFIASQRKHPNTLAIFALNLFLGWSILGWVAALVWSLTAVQATSNPIQRHVRSEPIEDSADQLQRLRRLLDEGAIDEAEFKKLRKPFVSRLLS